MAIDLSLYKVDLTTPQPDGRQGETPRSAFTKYNDLVGVLETDLPSGGTGGGASTAYSAMTAGASATISVGDDLVKVTLTAPMCNLTLAAKSSYEGDVRRVRLYLVQGTGSNQITWPLSVRWAYSTVPPLSFDHGEMDVIELESVDDGATWIGIYNGGWLSA